RLVVPVRRAALLHALESGLEGLDKLRVGDLGLRIERRAGAQEERAVEWSAGAADRADQRHPGRLEQRAGVLVADRGQLHQYGLKAPVHVDSVIAIAYGRVQAG